MKNDQNSINSDFYRALEDKFRGSHEIIKNRLKVYLPFIEQLKSIDDDTNVLDLGCGRGEWLELLKENGYRAFGIDMDDSMLEACRKLDLNVKTDDAISFLKSTPDESLSVISGFHLAEHLEFRDLHTLVSESLRALKPAGLLILETPNPENISVATWKFYLDPTHIRPIPPKLLSFLTEYYGYEKNKVLRLQEPLDNHKRENSSLNAVLNNVSPDYAVIAQKTAESELINLTRAPFEIKYGTTLEQVTTAFDKQTQTAAEKVKQTEIKAEQADIHARQAIELLHTINNSFSWHITAPLRWFERQIKLIYQQGILTRIKALVKKVGKPIVIRIVTFIHSHPGLHTRLIYLSKKLGLYKPLRSKYLQHVRLSSSAVPIDIPFTLQHLTPRARLIYAELISAVASKQGIESKK